MVCYTLIWQYSAFYCLLNQLMVLIMKSSEGHLVFKHYFENVSTFTYTLDIVRKSSNLLHRVKTKLSNSAETENSIHISNLLIPKLPSVSILDHRYRSLKAN